MGESRERSQDSDRHRKKDRKEKKSKKDDRKEDKKHKKKEKHRKRSSSRRRSHSGEKKEKKVLGPTIEELAKIAKLNQQKSIIPGVDMDKFQGIISGSQTAPLAGIQSNNQALIPPGQPLQGITNDQIQTIQSKSAELQTPQQLMQQLALVKAQQELATSKADRKIYVGNIPINITTGILTEVLNQALKQLKVNTEPPGDSIVGTWISPDQHYSFAEFRTPEEATLGLKALSAADLKLYGQAIKLGRPKQFLQQNAAIEATQNMSNTSALLLGEVGFQQVAPSGGPDNDTIAQLNPLLHKINPLGARSIFDGTTSTKCFIKKIQTPTRVIVLKNLFAPQELAIDEEFDDIYEDVKDECSKFGQVLNLVFPRPQQNEFINIAKGHGLVFCRYSTVEEAKEARHGLNGRQYGKRTIEIKYMSEEKFSKEDYNIIELI